MSDILDFYTNVLTALRYRVEDDALISFMHPDGKITPATVDGRRLVLPTLARQREGFIDDLQPFHPLSESIASKGASPVLAHMQRTAKAVLAYYFSALARQLLHVAATPSLHKDLPPACTEYLKKVSKADKRTVKLFEQLLEKATLKNQLITLYIKNGGKIDGKNVNRLTVIRFPIIDLLEEGSNNVLGVELNKKQRETIAAILRHVMPFGNDPEQYSAGSNSRIAPFFDSFMRAYAKAAKQLNKGVRKYAKAMGFDLVEIPLDYLEDLDDLGQFYEKIPPLRGNDGATVEADTTTPAVQRDVGQRPAGTTTTAPSPRGAATRTTTGSSDGSKVTMEEFMKRLHPQQPPQQSAAPYGAPHGAPVQPVHNPYAAPAAAQPRDPLGLFGPQSYQPTVVQNPFAQALQLGGGGQPTTSSPYGGGTPYSPQGGLL